MGKSQPDDPPMIPPRTKKNKKGPALPEKPAHMKPHSSQPREPLKPTNRPDISANQREVLIAASKFGRERPVDKRQREPPKLLVPTAKMETSVPWKQSTLQEMSKKEMSIASPHTNHLWMTSDDVFGKKPEQRLSKGVSSRGLQDMVPSSKREMSLVMTQNPLWNHLDDSKRSSNHQIKSNRPLQQPILLVPRNLLATWVRSTPNVSYALWSASQRDNRAAVRQPVRQQTSGTSTVRLRSGNSVTRSGSLTSQGSNSGSDSETLLPKSVLKKQRRKGADIPSPDSRKVDHKKNVTFNAFATVQLMEE